MLNVVVLLCLAVGQALAADYLSCNCGALFFTDSKCTTTLYPTQSFEFQDRCVSERLPLGTWVLNVTAPPSMLGVSYKIKKCVSKWSSKAIVGVNDKIDNVEFYQWNTSNCSPSANATSKQVFPPDGSCQPIWVFSDLFYARFICSGAVSALASSSAVLSLLLLGVSLWWL